MHKNGTWLKADREQILSFLTTHRQEILDGFSLETIALVGSIARNDYRDDSDVDIMVEFRPDIESIHRTKAALSEYLESEVHRPVQIISKRFIRPQYRRAVLGDAVALRPT